ncbi:hypothetical protein [Sinomonas sp. B1-1]|uniref:hypothetical protein n=1 Tax=Sinomonas sp. B1-1 TaxID=3141454 RepID=UPI003D29E680
MKFSMDKVTRGDVPGPSEIFTDRIAESTAFKRSLESFRRLLDSEDELTDARRNVLAFAGTGGVGKTKLSERLEDWALDRLSLEDRMDGWGQKPSTVVDHAVRIDLKGKGGHFELLNAVKAIRLSLGRLKRSWPAFDFAFAAYWQSAHPGEPLPTAGMHDNGFSSAIEETVSKALSEIGVELTDLAHVDPLVSSGVGWARIAVGAIRRRHTRRLAFESFDGYRSLIERLVDEPSSSEPREDLILELASLLALELAQNHGKEKQPMVVVFVDHFERLSLDPRRNGEVLFNQLVWRMPNVLFVVTGRDAIDWCDTSRTELKHVGPLIWPGLAGQTTDDPRQHLVGKLSDQDARKVISKAAEHSELVIPEGVVDDLVKNSGGLPLYLELALTAAIYAKMNGAPAVTLDHVSGSLVTLVERVLEYVPEDEQRALRAASLFTYFDTELIAAAADVDHGAAERAVRRPMVERRDDGRFPYRMHDEVRHALRTAGHRVSGGWAERDWEEAASRALEQLRHRYAKASSAKDGPLSLAAVGLAITLVCEQQADIGASDSEKYADWLTKAIVYGPSISGLVKHVPVASATDYGQSVLDFISAKTYDLPEEERWKLLRRILASDHPLAMPAGRHLGYGLRNSSRWDESYRVFAELEERAPSELHSYHKVLTLATARRFRDAIDGIESLPPSRRGGVLVKVDLAHGRPDDWLAFQARVIERTGERDAQRERLEAVGSLLKWRTILSADVSPEEARSLEAESDAVGFSAVVRDALASQALLDPLGDPAPVARLEALDRIALSGQLGHRTATVKTLRAMVAGDRRALEQIRDEIENRSGRGRIWIPIECLLSSLGLPVTLPPTQWLEPYRDVEERWRRILDAYAARFS